jgi:pimeloyl-ACP methyl ester carboxylesterase
LANQLTRAEFFAALLAGAALSPRPLTAAGMGDMLWEHTLDYLRRLDEKRQARFDALRTPADLEALRRDVRAELVAMWGPLPATRTPLNPRQVGTIERSGYVIERIIFESRPRFYVTANLYRPRDVTAPLPAVLFSPGHAPDGKAHPAYQRFCARMARLGFVTLTWDPVCQGERLQLWDSATKMYLTGRGTVEHTFLGRQCYLVGLNLMQYRVWDAIRAIDYLETRPEVDAERIAMAGHSGGGVETMQLASLDRRLKAAVALCAVASFRDNAEALILGDPEQVLYGSLLEGIDHPELLASFAPRPLMIGATAEDFIPVEGTRRTYAAVARAFSILDAAGKAGLTETPGNHDLNPGLEQAAATWIQQWCAHPSDQAASPGHEAEDEVLPAEQLHCTAGGQLAGSFEASTVLSWNLERAQAIAPQRKMPSTRDEFLLYQGEIAQHVREITRVGQFKAEAGIYVPDRTFEVGAFSRGVALVVADLGKDHPLVRRALIDPLVASGYRVVALDLRGWGEAAPHLPRLKVPFSWDDFFANRALEIGRPLLGQRMKDLLSVGPTRALRGDWILAGVGAGALVAAHAAVIEPRVKRLITVGGLLSYRSLLEDPLAVEPFSSFLPGVIGAYDVRDLYAAAAPRPVLVVNPADARRVPMERVAAREKLDWAGQVYETMGAAGSFSLETKVSSEQMRQIVTDWLKG